MRRPFNYSLDKLNSKRGSKDRGRTIDCHHMDQTHRVAIRDDSEEPSDWKEQTSLSMEELRTKDKKERDQFREKVSGHKEKRSCK